MEEAKRRCFSPLNPSETPRGDTIIRNLMSLNDHCILRIFEWLELDMLCVVGETCKRLQHLVVMFFKQKYHSKMMTEVRIQVTIDGRIFLTPAEKYVKFFLNFMQNITLSGGYQRRPFDVLAFILKNCKTNIRQIAFEDMKFNRLHGAIIIEWLKTVETVALFGCQNVHEILKYCDNLKNLKIDKYSKDSSNEWMTKKYLTLERLQYDQLPNKLSNAKILTFLKINPNVKSLMLEFDASSERFAEQILRQLWAIDLEELLLTINIVGYLMLWQDRVRDALEKLCERGRLKRLHLCFPNGLGNIDTVHISNQHSMVKCFEKLNCLEGLHLLSNDYKLPSNLFQHLKVFHLEYVSENVSTDIISKNLPNLEELYVAFLLTRFKEFVAPFVRNATKLSKIVARDIKIENRVEMTNYRLAMYFNDERGQLLNPCKVIIYIGKDEFDISFDTMPSKFDLVEIRQVEFLSKRFSFAKPYLGNFEF